MPLFVIIGMEGHSFNSKAEAIYVGTSGEDANAAIAAIPPGKFARAGKLVNPAMIPVSLPNPPAKTEVKQDKPKTKIELKK